MKKGNQTTYLNSKEKIRSTFIWLFGIVFILKLQETFCFFNFSDPIAYHLVGPRLWYETSFYQMMSEHDAFLISGVFDYLYIIPTVLFYPNKFLIVLFSQNMHFMFSLGFGSIILLRHFGINALGALAALSLLTISRSANFFIGAKNDGVVALVVMLVALLVSDEKFLKKIGGIKRVLLTGFLLGLAPAIKMNGLFFIAPISIYYAWINRKNLSYVFLAALIALITLSPILFRNWYFMGNPIFPGLMNHLPGKASQGIIDSYAFYMSNPFHLGVLGEHLKMLFMGKAYFLLIPALAIYQHIIKKDRYNIYFYFAIIGHIIYVLVNGGITSNRFIFSAYFLFTVFIFKSLTQYKLKTWMLITILALIMIDSKIDKSVKRLTLTIKRHLSMTQTEIIRTIEPHAQFWEHIKEDDLKKERVYVVTDDFPNMFYAPRNVRVESINLDRDANVLKYCDDLRKMKRFSYAIIHRNIDNECYKLIKEKGKFLTKIGRYNMYDLSKVPAAGQSHQNN